jgi:hypothetical protein
MFDKESPDLIWVSSKYAEEEYGTWEQPYSSIEDALEHLDPGKTLVLKDGVYEGDLTIQVSGTARNPIRIMADDDAQVVITGGCWFLYDTSDLIVSGLTFKDAPHGALSVIGKCNRNRFDLLNFINCGLAAKASCTMYFGGSGGSNNIVENCTFEANDQTLENSKGESIALMISEGDLDDGDPVKSHIIRKNSFKKYGYGVLVGSSNTSTNQYGHIVEYNRIDTCSRAGILVKCGDTLIRGNMVQNCNSNSITVMAGSASVIDSNRIVDCDSGIRVNGSGHTVVNNCVVRTKTAAVRACGNGPDEVIAASNLFIENNTFVWCGINNTDKKSSAPGVQVEAGTSCIIRKNLIYGMGNPLILEDKISSVSPAPIVSDENAISDDTFSRNGFIKTSVVFSDECMTFDNTSGFGAQGWVLTPQVFDPAIDETDEESDYIEGAILEDDNGELIIPSEEDSQDLFSHLYGQITNGEFSEQDEMQ